MSSNHNPHHSHGDAHVGKPPESAGCCGGMFTEAKKDPTRRDFILLIGSGLNVVAGMLMGIPVLGFLMSSWKRRSPQKWLSVGSLTKFPEHTTRLASYTNPGAQKWDGQMSQIPCWVRRLEGEKFQVFAINCTHLGCPVRYFEESKLFMCPCHGGAFYQDGRHAAGPPPRGLYEYEYKVENGELLVNAGQIPTLSQPV